jgi:GNAT superfamily N-acetyltransferase
LTTGKNYLTITRGAIDASVRKLGYGSYIFKKALDLCQSRGANSVRSETGLKNYGMQQLYAKNGMKLCGKIYDFKFKEYFLAYEKVFIQPSL